MLIVWFADQCVMTEEVYLTYYPAPAPVNVGYIELDGVEGLTDPSELVQLNDTIEPGMVIIIDDCNNW